MSNTYTLDVELFVDLDNNWEEYHFYKNIVPLNNGINDLPLRICRDELILSKLIPIIDYDLTIKNRNSKFIWAKIDLSEDEFMYLDLKYELVEYSQPKSLNLLNKKETKCLDSHIKI